MAITHGFRRARDFEFDRAAKAFSCLAHNKSPFTEGARRRRNCNVGPVFAPEGLSGIISAVGGLGLSRPTMRLRRHRADRAFSPGPHVCVASSDRMTPNSATTVSSLRGRRARQAESWTGFNIIGEMHDRNWQSYCSIFNRPPPGARPDILLARALWAGDAPR